MTKATRRKLRELPDDTIELLEMLTWCRPSGGVTERNFVAKYVTPLGTTEDDYGNQWLTIGASDILWSCHTDTVHRKEGSQNVLYGDGFATVEKGECLGADCGAGVWLMRQMILARVPGTYVFHTDEEVGGIGSDHVARHEPERLANINHAIAFDRTGITDIITHQAGRRTASNLFATSLAEILRPLGYKASNGGTFTDTANYADHISECTNIAVGYYEAHTSKEWLDVEHVTKLRDVLISADWSRLVTNREPTPEVQWWKRDPWADEWDAGQTWDNADLADYVRRNPTDVANFLNANGFNATDIDEFVHMGMG